MPQPAHAGYMLFHQAMAKLIGWYTGHKKFGIADVHLAQCLEQVVNPFSHADFGLRRSLESPVRALSGPEALRVDPHMKQNDSSIRPQLPDSRHAPRGLDDNKISQADLGHILFRNSSFAHGKTETSTLFR